jgi:hypothetical protein
MITNKDLKNMPTKEMIKCDGCDRYHPLEECEVVIIRMIKGKNCELKSEQPRTTETVDAPVVDRVVATVIPTVNTPVVPSSEGYHIPPREVEEMIKKRKNIIPSGIASMMLSPADPNFDAKGAKEIRKY